MSAPFFIRDCAGNIVGNPAGYRTMRGAMREANRRGSPAYNAIYAADAARTDTDTGRLLWRISYPAEGGAA